MSEQDHRGRVEAWLAEGQDEPTPFGAAVVAVCGRRGFGDPQDLDLDADSQWALSDHLDGVDNCHVPMLPLAVVGALGIDLDAPRHTDDGRDARELAERWTFGYRFSPKPA